MGIHYLRVVTDESNRIAAIGSRWLDDAGGFFTLAFAAKHPRGERGIVDDFIKQTGFWSRRWQFVPTGLHLDEQLGALWHASSRYGHIEFGADPWGRKPTLDLFPVLALFNSNAKRPDGTYGDAPTMFYGASLERYTQTNIGSGDLLNLLKNKQMVAVEKILRLEHDRFMLLYELLKSSGPAWWKRDIEPALSSRNVGAWKPPT